MIGYTNNFMNRITVDNDTNRPNQGFFSSIYLQLIILTLFLSLFSGLAEAKNVKVIMYGDSISAGYGMTSKESWPYLLNQTFINNQDNIELINESISGETTGGGLARLDNVLSRHKLSTKDWLIIELGGNDGLRGFPINTLKNNLIQMIEKVTARGANVALMQIRIPPNYGRRYTKMLEDVYPKLAKQYDLPLLPFFMEKIATNPNYMQNDGLHPNISAQVIIRDLMKPEIEKLVQ